MPISPGRPRLYSQGELRNLWIEFKARIPKGTRKAFADEVGLSASRVKAILNDQPSEINRKARLLRRKAAKRYEKYHDLNTDDDTQKEDSYSNKPSGLMFFHF